MNLKLYSSEIMGMSLKESINKFLLINLSTTLLYEIDSFTIVCNELIDENLSLIIDNSSTLLVELYFCR